MTSSAASIVPITITVNDRTGLTLWAPPWEDEHGDEWQGFLGDGSKILLYPSTAELAAFVASGVENDLSDHPGWGQVLKATPDQLRPDAEDRYDLDLVYEWASGDPDPVHVSALADVVDMVAKIADCCDDGALRGLVEGTPAYAELVDDEISYQGKDGKKRWNELGDVIAGTWERAITRVNSWLSWQGDFSSSEFDEEETLWEHIGAEPIEITLPDSVVLTVRGVVPDADFDTADQGPVVRGDNEVVAAYDAGGDYEMAFLGNHDAVAVFSDVAGLATYCRTATGHRLRKLEWWDELADVEDDALFTPETDGRIDLRRPSVDGALLLLDLGRFCRLDADLSAISGVDTDDEDAAATVAGGVAREDWNRMVDEVVTCLRLES